MKYSDGQVLKIGDIVLPHGLGELTIVIDFESGDAAEGFNAADWGETVGVLARQSDGALIYFDDIVDQTPKPWSDTHLADELTLVRRKHPRYWPMQKFHLWSMFPAMILADILVEAYGFIGLVAAVFLYLVALVIYVRLGDPEG